MVELQLHQRCLSLKVMYVLKRLIMRNIQTVHFLNRKATDTTPPGSPIVNTDLTGKATTKTPVDVSSSEHCIELLDKDNHVIGSGTTGANGHVIITPTQPIPKVMLLRKLTIMQNIQIVLHLNRKATDTTPTAPVVTSDLTGKATTMILLKLLRIRIRKWNY